MFRLSTYNLRTMTTSLTGQRVELCGDCASHNSGFTLIELLIVATILPLIIGAISVAMVSVFSLQAGVSSGLTNSADAQIVSANFVKDVQSAQEYTTQTQSQPQCGAGVNLPGVQSPGIQLLGLAWNVDQNNAYPFQNVVSYDSVSVPNGSSLTYQLWRKFCTLGNTTPVSMTLVSQDLTSGQLPPCIITTSSQSSQVCVAPTTAWHVTASVAKMTISIFEPSSKFAYSLAAVPRAGTSSPGGSATSQTFAPLTVLGLNSCANQNDSQPVLTVGNTGNNGNNDGQQGTTLMINSGGGSGNGVLQVNSTACPIQVGNNATISANALVTSNPSFPSVCVPNGSLLCYYSPPPSPPFANLSAVPFSAPPNVFGVCTPTSRVQNHMVGANDRSSTSTWHCSPGYYSSDPFNQTWGSHGQIAQGDTVTFGPASGSGNITDQYWFAKRVKIPSQVTAAFSAGTYIFNGTGSALSTQNGSVVLTSTVNSTVNNVLFYVPNGNVNFGNNVQINLSGSSTYDGVAIWDASSGGSVTLGNSVNLAINGGIYVPLGSFVSGKNSTVGASFIVAGSATFNNGAQVTLTAP